MDTAITQTENIIFIMTGGYSLATMSDI